MPLSMHQASVPVFLRALKNLSGILDKAVAHATQHKLALPTLLDAKLAPDMFPLVRQVQTATDIAKGCTHRLAALEIPSFPDTEKTFPELQERLQKTMDLLKSIPAEKLEGSETREVSQPTRNGPILMPGQTYLLAVGLPNFFFHVTTAYDILRNQGVPLTKRDYLA